MNILILGATGRTGSILARMALAKNHHVTAIVRNPSKATLEGVHYIGGSPMDAHLLNNALQGMDAVVVSLNISRTSDNPYAKVVSPLTLISDTVAALLPAMEKNGVKRIISVSASGVGDSFGDMPLVARWLIRSSNIWKAYLDHDRQEQLLRKSGADWTIVRPVMLNNRETVTWRAAEGKPTGGSISRTGVAAFILEALETGKYTQAAVTIHG
jgi:uncharacterized protein YbjT (DUF2867 family)